VFAHGTRPNILRIHKDVKRERKREGNYIIYKNKRLLRGRLYFFCDEISYRRSLYKVSCAIKNRFVTNEVDERT